MVDLGLVRRFRVLPVKERPYKSADLPSVMEIYTASIRSLATFYYSPDHPAFARRGVATNLYQHVESSLRAVRAHRVTTHASLAARPFFDRHGFLLDAEECVECRGVYLRRFAMSKELRNEQNA